MIGQTISHYKILEKIGEGGMGVVYKAEDTKLRRPVALKFLPPNILVNESDRRRFVHEAQASAALSHPNIATVFEIDESEAKTFIALEYIEGRSVAEKIKSGPLKLDDALAIAIQICEGLQAAHEKGIIHRDIKTQNIMVTTNNQVKILDFGLAKLRGASVITKSGTTLGTVGYMSPEQLRGEAVDHRTDIWAVGVVLYEMIAGRRPFQADYEEAVGYKVLNQQPEPLTAIRTGVPMELERIVNKLLSKNSAERYQSMTDLIVDLRTLKRTTDSGISHAPAPSSVLRRKGLLIGSGVLLLLLVTGVLYYMLTSRPSGQIRSLAVLPFVNLSNIADQEYFVDGMTEAVTSDLAKIGSLKVISRTSAMQYKGKRKLLAEIAKELGVDAVIEGSVLRAGNKVRITAQLINAERDEHLWADSYDGELTDILSLQSTVARAIAGQIKVTLSSDEKRLLTETRKVNQDAYDAYLKGKFYSNRFTNPDMQKAIEYFNKAINLDPTLIEAYAGLSFVYSMETWWTYLDPADALPNARAASEKALEIDANNGEAILAMSRVKIFSEWSASQAEPLLRKALLVMPNNSQLYREYAFFLVLSKRYTEAIAAAKRALELDPLTQDTHFILGWTLFMSGLYDESIQQFKKNLGMDKTADYFAHMLLGWNYEAKGLFDKAISECDQALSDSSMANNLVLASSTAYVYAKSGKPERATELLNHLVIHFHGQYLDPYYIATIYAGLGKNDKAFQWLYKGLEQRSPSMIAVYSEPFFINLRSDPRFDDLVKRIGF